MVLVQRSLMIQKHKPKIHINYIYGKYYISICKESVSMHEKLVGTKVSKLSIINDPMCWISIGNFIICTIFLLITCFDFRFECNIKLLVFHVTRQVFSFNGMLLIWFNENGFVMKIYEQSQCYITFLFLFCLFII